MDAAILAEGGLAFSALGARLARNSLVSPCTLTSTSEDDNGQYLQQPEYQQQIQICVYQLQFTINRSK